MSQNRLAKFTDSQIDEAVKVIICGMDSSKISYSD